MPVESYDLAEPPADIRFEQPESPIVVGSDNTDDAHKSTGFHEVEVGDEEVTADWHDQSNVTVQFEQPGPEVVQLEGFRKPQSKTVAPAPKPQPSQTSGAQSE